MIDFSSLKMRPTPFPMGEMIHPFDDREYEQLVAHFPPVHYAVLLEEKRGMKASLSMYTTEKSQATFFSFINSTRIWKQLFDYTQSDRCFRDVLDAIEKQGFKIPGVALSATFEFSFLPADFGPCVVPHTDSPSKLCAFVFPMVFDGEWDEAWDGGTRMLDENHETVLHCPYKPNRANVLLKRDNSWHEVRCTAPKGTTVMRKSITFNLVEVGVKHEYSGR